MKNKTAAQKTPAKKRTAKIVYRNGNNFWTTQKQFWSWVRAGVVKQTGDRPLKGIVVQEAELKLIIRNHTILDLAAPTHLAEMTKINRLKQ